jgi:hypothetical protein
MENAKRFIVVTAICIAAAVFALLSYWIITLSLESWGTVAAGVVLCGLLVGIAFLAWRGKVRMAAWALTALLWLATLAVSASYGLGTPSIAGFILPILLSVLALGPQAGMGVTLATVIAVWCLGLAAALGWFQPSIPYQASDLTFNAPFYTLLFTLVTVMAGNYTIRR